jgi:hypothetical protein
VYVGQHIRNGWVPADEGTLAQSALRVLNGQLPHRDYVEIYTGGLSLIHALAFRAFGMNLMSLRICAFLFFLAWIPAVYSIAVRFTSALGAGLITLLAVSWSYPNYPAAMPSWYNLFFATFGAAALLRYLEVHKSRWLFAAGICGGISILIKVIGAYYIAGVLLFLVFVEQGDVEANETQKRAILYRIFSASSLLIFLAVAIRLFRGRLGGGELYEFVLPAGTLVGLVLLSECGIRSDSSGARFRGLFCLIGPFAAGLLAPVIMFLLPYARSGALGAFFSGVSGSAIARSAGLGVMRPAGMRGSLCSLALVALVAAAIYRREFQGKIVASGISVGLAALLYRSDPATVSGIWLSAATLTPLVVLAGAAVVLMSGKSEALTTLQRQRVMLLISLAGLCSLVQFPFAAPIYLSYSLPLALLAASAIVTTVRKQAGTYVLASVMAFYLLFAVVRLVPNYIYELTHRVGPLADLRIERAGGLRTEFAPDFEEIIRLLRQHSPNGLLYAGNDCPEFYFLAGLRNVTRDDGGAQPEEVLQALQAGDVKVVLINEKPFFPGSGISAAVRAEVMRRFPEDRRIGIFHVFWRQ